EPTNHLDLQSRQFLEEVLSDFEGTLLFVSHDRYFIDRLATKVWAIEDSVLSAYAGNYTEFRTRRRSISLETSTTRATKPASQTKAVPEKGKANNKKASKAKVRTLEDVERDVEKAEASVKSVEA